MKYFFYYYFHNGLVMSAKIIEEGGRVVGPPVSFIKELTFEITKEQFDNASLFQLNADFPFPEPELIDDKGQHS